MRRFRKVRHMSRRGNYKSFRKHHRAKKINFPRLSRGGFRL